MGAQDTRTTRRIRALAVATMLLTALAVLSPALAHHAGPHAHHMHGAKIVALVTADQAGLTVRTDQSVVASQATPAVSLAQWPEDRTEPGAAHDGVEIESADPRGPPGAR